MKRIMLIALCVLSALMVVNCIGLAGKPVSVAPGPKIQDGCLIVDDGKIALGELLFEDDFSDENASLEMWAISSGESDSFWYEDATMQGTGPRTVTTMAGDQLWADYVISCDVYTTSETNNPWGGIVFRGSDEWNRYAVEINPGKQMIGLQASLDGAEAWLGQWDYALQTDTWYNGILVVKGSHVTFYLNGEKIFDDEFDMLFESGAVGVRTGWGNVFTAFDNYKVWALAE